VSGGNPAKDYLRGLADGLQRAVDWWDTEPNDAPQRIADDRDGVREDLRLPEHGGHIERPFEDAPPLAVDALRLPVAWFAGIAPAPVRGAAAPTWRSLVGRLSTFPHLPAGTDKKAAPGWAPIAWADGAPRMRAAANVGAVSALVLDLDRLSDLGQLEAAMQGLRAQAEQPAAAVAHSSWSHRPGAPKARLVLPFAEPVPVAQWPRVWAAGARWAAEVGLEADPACKDPGRWYLLPGLPEDAGAERWDAVWAHAVDGAPLDWRWLAAAYPPPPPELPVLPVMRDRVMPADDWRDHERHRAARWMEGTVRAVAKTQSGGRNSRLLVAARDLGQLAAAGLVDAAPWAAALTHAAIAAGLPASEVARTVASGEALGRKDPPWTWPNR